MKLPTAVETLVFTTLIACASCLSLHKEWAKFKIDYGKKYSTLKEESNRFSIFKSNLEIIGKHNENYENGVVSYTMAVNQFADLTWNEFKVRLGLKPNHSLNLKEEYFGPGVEDDVPQYVNWAEKGVVTEVKNQGSCGSCWSFSVTGAIESALAINTGRLVSLSEQNLVDCVSCGSYGGCNGCYLDVALEYVRKNGIMSERDYCYNASKSSCRFDESKVAAHIESYAHVTPPEEDALKKATASIGPIAVTIDVERAFMFYSSGILEDNECSNQAWKANHAVLVVGYGSHEGKNYWIVKNSWGPKWGQKGYVYMSRDHGNQCGIASTAYYPIGTH
uniref:Cathepsin L8 n=1 Tax=Zabrotes subfasciatus TaxID=122865 RepID=A0A8K1XDT6_ZABSU|nr:cathepsin L8 [Zabrotes subfasciatus]